MSTETIITLIISFFATLGLGGIIGVLIQRRFEQQKQINEHDIKIFNLGNDILGEKKLIDSILNFQLINSHRIVHDDFILLSKWCEFSRQIGNQYLNEDIKTESQKLLRKIDLLVGFIGKNFEELVGQNPNNTNIYLKPDLDPDRSWDDHMNQEKVDKYWEYVKELNTLVEEVEKQYSVYRLVIKNRLKT